MRRATACLILLLVMFLPLLVSATAQQGDILFLDGKKYSVHTNPLQEFLDRNPGKLPKSDVVSSSNWRGYVATWEVRDDRFLLIDVTILRAKRSDEKGLSTEPISVMSAVFPGQKEVLASWFTDHVIVPDGKLVSYVHMGYASTFERYIILRVESGLVTRNWRVDAAGFAKFRDAQFLAFKKTQEFRDAFAQTMKDGDMSAKECEEFLRQFYAGTYMSMVFDKRP